MQVILQPDPPSAVRLTARLVAETLQAKPDCVLGLATGRTMEPLYARLAELHREEGLDFSRCRTFNLDEYVGVSPEDPRSYRHTMQTLLFEHVNMRPEATHLPDGMARDVPRACLEYEQAIAKAGGIDLQVLGLGSDGHIGFNEPLSSFASKTRGQCLTPDTIRQNAGLCGGESRVPRRAMTMGIGTILSARRVLLLATGRNKARVLAQVVEGPITAMLSGSALHFHPDCTVIADAEAGAELGMADYYRFAFENSPEWNDYR